MSSDSGNTTTSHTSTSDDESRTSEISQESTASAVSSTTQEFRIQLIHYMNTQLGIECEIDSLEQQDNDNHGPETYTIRDYTIIRFPTNPANPYHRCFIWSENAYFLVDLTTDRASMHLFSTKTCGKLVNAVLRTRPGDDLLADKLVLLYKGIPEKSDKDVPRGKFDILAEPFYQRLEYSLDFDSPEIQMTYIPESTQVYSYPNDRRPDISN